MATESDNVNSGALGTLLSVGAFATLGIALVVTALVRAEIGEEMEKKDVEADRPFRDMVSEQTAKLAAPAAYVDRGRGLVSLPIERAMELTVSGLKKDPNSATPPPPVGGAGGAAGSAAIAETGGTGGTGAEIGGTGGTGGLATDAADKPAEDPKPGDEKKDQPDEKKQDAKKDGAKPKPLAPVPASPAPAAPAPAAPAPAAPAAPAPAAPAPHGQ